MSHAVYYWSDVDEATVAVVSWGILIFHAHWSAFIFYNSHSPTHLLYSSQSLSPAENGGGGTLNLRDDNVVFTIEVDGNGGGQGFELANDARMNGRHSSSTSRGVDSPDNYDDDEGEDGAKCLAFFVLFFNSRAWRLIGSMIIVFAFALAAAVVSKVHQQKQIEASMQYVEDCPDRINIVATREAPADSVSAPTPSLDLEFLLTCNAITTTPGSTYDPPASTCINDGYECTAGNNECKGKTTGTVIQAQCCSCEVKNGCAGAGSYCGTTCPVSPFEMMCFS